MDLTSTPSSDGCTGFQFLEGLFDGLRDCCAVHDMGGSDGALLDCMQAVLPGWAWVPAALCVALMIALRPIYHKLKPTIEAIRRRLDHGRD